MASALDVPIPKTVVDGDFPCLPKEVRAREQSISEITEMIHVASLLHVDVSDDAETRHGISSLKFVMGNKLAVLAREFLLSRACVALASLKNTEGIVTAPILFAMEEFPQLHELIDRGFSDIEDVDVALNYLGKSRGIQKTRELAQEHATHAVKAIKALPEPNSEDARISRSALVDLTRRVITRTK